MADNLQISNVLSLPLDAVTLTTAILGIRNTGKTNTATVFVEEALAHGQRSIIVDPLDVWWGLKSSADGKSPGLDVIVFGGHHADLPLELHHATKLADLLAENPITAVLSIAHLRKGERVRFVAEFCERLYHRKGEAELRDRLLVVVDEASMFVPQQGNGGIKDPSVSQCIGAIEDMVRRGRSRGLGVVLVDFLVAAADDLREAGARIRAILGGEVPAPTSRAESQVSVDADRSPRPQREPTKPVQGVSGPQSRMLAALASFHALGVESMSKGNLAVFSDQSPKSSGYRANLSSLSAKQLIAYTGEGVALTPMGREVAGNVHAPAALADLHRAWKSKLSQPQGRMLSELIRLYPDGIHRSVLAKNTNQSLTSSGYRANLSKIVGLGLARYNGPDVHATSLLFPEGLK